MTRKEVIGNLNMIRVAFIDTVTVEQGKIIDDTFRAAIETLKQEPCEDCISRQAVLDINESHHGQMPNHINHQIWQEIKELPPVNPLAKDYNTIYYTPQPKTGHWIEEIDDYGKVTGWHCDKCYEDSGFTTDCKWNYCPNCGAKMIESQETETWNGIHAQITAPKGTFERIFNDADDDNDI